MSSSGSSSLELFRLGNEETNEVAAGEVGIKVEDIEVEEGKEVNKIGD